MNMSLLGVLLVGALGVCTSVTAVLAYASVAREARCRRRRSRLRLVVGAGASSQRTHDGQRPRIRPVDDRREEIVSWDPLPVTQWTPPREHEADWPAAGERGPEPSPAADAHSRAAMVTPP